MKILRKYFSSKKVFVNGLLPTPVKDVSDKDLRHISRENKKKLNRTIVATSTVFPTASLGTLVGEKIGKRCMKLDKGYIRDCRLEGYRNGAMVGAGLGLGIGVLMSSRMKKDAKTAREELNRRYKDKKNN